MKKEIFKTITIEPFNADIVFYFSKDFGNITKQLNKDKDTSKWITKHVGTFEHPAEHTNACVIQCPDDYPLIIWVKDKKQDWTFYESIMHEVNHVVELLSRYYKFERELEFKAYLTTYIFRKIRKLIQ